MNTHRRVALVSLTLLATALVYLLVTMLASLIGWAVAHADTGSAVDPGLPVGKYGWWSGVLLAYVAVRWLLKRNESEHWIAHGRTLSISTAVLSVVGSVIGWRLGMDPDTIGFAVAGAVPLAIPSTITPKPALPPPPTSTASGGTIE